MAYECEYDVTIERYLCTVPEVNRLEKDVTDRDDRIAYGAAGAHYLGALRCAKVAIKRFHGEQVSGSAARVFSEITVLQQVKHPNLVQFLGVCPPSPEFAIPRIVFELLSITLRKRYLTSSLPPLSQFDHAKIASDISSGVDYLHSKNILHRDLTPSNMMLSGYSSLDIGFTAKIIDLGSAKEMIVGAISQPLSANSGHNCFFMAPETSPQGSEEQSWYGPPSDVYSSAASMFCMMTAQDPPCIVEVDAMTYSETRMQYLQAVGSDNGLGHVTRACLDSDPNERMRASEVCKKLTHILRESEGHQTLQSRTPLDFLCLQTENESLRMELREERKDKTRLNEDVQQVQARMHQATALLQERDAELADRGSENELLRQRLVRADAQVCDLQAKLAAYRAFRWQRLLNESSLQNDQGVLARSCLLSGHPDIGSTLEWKVFGHLPELNWTGTPAIHDGKIYCFMTRIFQSPAQAFCMPLAEPDASDPQWEVAPQPSGQLSVGSSFFSHSGDLYAVCLPFNNRNQPPVIQKFEPNSEEWLVVAQLPFRFHYYGTVLITDSQLFIIGTCFPAHGRNQRKVISCDLELGIGEEWTVWPDFPYDHGEISLLAKDERIIAVHHSVDSRHVYELDTSHAVPRRARWKTSSLPHPSMFKAEVLVANGQMLACGGSESGGLLNVASVVVEMYTGDSQWLPMPSLQHARYNAHLLQCGRHIICFGGFYDDLAKSDDDINKYHTAVRPIEVLELFG